MSNPPQTVSATKAGYSLWQPNIEAIGSLRAVKGADLSLEVSGVVNSISFNSGDDVAEGAPLLKLRSDDDAAKLEIAARRRRNSTRSPTTAIRSNSSSRRSARPTWIPMSANLKNANAQVAQQQAILDKKFYARRLPAISVSAPSISANISPPERPS